MRVVLQYFAIPIVLQPTFIGCLVANTAYAFACVYYHYITFLGYNCTAQLIHSSCSLDASAALPFLKNQTVFLLPVGLILLLYLISIALRYRPSTHILSLPPPPELVTPKSIRG